MMLLDIYTAATRCFQPPKNTALLRFCTHIIPAEVNDPTLQDSDDKNNTSVLSILNIWLWSQMFAYIQPHFVQIPPFLFYKVAAASFFCF